MIRAFAISKLLPWRGSLQRTTNVYHYQGLLFTQGHLDACVDRIVAIERPLTSVEHVFETARVWSAGGTPSENETLLVKDLTGTGSGSTDSSMYREAAHLFQWECERKDSRGRKKYLRKWMHFGAPRNWYSDGSRKAPDYAIDDMNTAYTRNIERLDIGIADFTPYNLCSPKGELPREVEGGASGVVYKGTVYPYLEHRQLGDQWR